MSTATTLGVPWPAPRPLQPAAQAQHVAVPAVSRKRRYDDAHGPAATAGVAQLLGRAGYGSPSGAEPLAETNDANEAWVAAQQQHVKRLRMAGSEDPAGGSIPAGIPAAFGQRAPAADGGDASGGGGQVVPLPGGSGGSYAELQQQAAQLGRALRDAQSQRQADLAAMHAAASERVASLTAELGDARAAGGRAEVEISRLRSEVARLEEEGKLLKRGIAIAASRCSAAEAKTGEHAAALEAAQAEVRRLTAANYALQVHFAHAASAAASPRGGLGGGGGGFHGLA